MRRKAIELFLAEEKNARTIEIIIALLKEESPTTIASRFDITRDAVYKIKDKYIKE